VLSGEATNTNFIVFGLTRPELEPTINRTQGEHPNYYTTGTVRRIRIQKCKVNNIIRDPRGITSSGYNLFTKFKSCNWNGTWNGYLNLQLRGKVCKFIY
jgi:hypothetical protein